MYTHTCVITQLVHTQLVHTHNFLTHNLSTHNLLTHNLSFLTSTFVTGVALGDIHLRFTWQAWHLVTSTFVARGRRGTYSTGRALVAHRVLMAADAVDAAALCVAGVALGDRRGTWRHPPSFHVAGVALGHIHIRFTWQARHLVKSRFVSRGRRGTWSHPHSFHVAGVALTALGGLWWRTGFSWQLTPWTPWLFAWQAWHLVTSTFTLRGRRGNWWHPPSLCVAGVALGDRRGTWRHPPSFHVAGVALGHIHIRFTWQAWHLRHWAGSGGAPGSQLTPWTPWLFAWQAWHLVTSTFTLRGRRGNWRHPPSLCVAGVALGDRRGTWRHPPSFHVAGVALTALGGLWWRTGFSADAVDAAALCVAGVALGDIHLHFAWQAWHLRHFAWQAWQLVTSTFTLRGRRGTRWHPPSLCVAGVTLIDTYDAGLVRFKLSRRYLASCAIHVLFVSWLCWRLRLFDRGRGKLSCRLLCSICCKHDAANGYERCFGQTAHVFGCFSVCVQMQQHLLPFPWLIRCTCTRFIENSAEVSSRTGSEEQGQMYIWIFCSICCKHDATNGASGRLLTFLAVSLCVCSNAATSIAISMAHQVHMHSLHWKLSRSVK